MKRIGLRLKFIILLIGIVAVMLVVNIFSTQNMQLRQAEAEMLEKAQILSQELDAFWTFMEINETRINTDSDGEEDFKGLYCVVAAKSVCMLFSTETDYKIQYTNLKTRRKADAPDEFEITALERFNNNPEVREHYALTEFEGEEAFRYVKSLYITDSCLKCHGDPVGELDIFGYPKEGMKIGDVAGAVSIVMPVDTYLNGLQNNITQQALLLGLLLVLCLAAVFIAVSKLVTRPLAKLESVAQQIEKGDFDVDVSGIGYRDEISDLSLHISTMANELSGFYGELESKVSERTLQLEEANKELDYRKHQLEIINEKLQKDSEYKSEYLATMSHELRTPLTSIIAFAEMWERTTGEKSAKDLHTVNEIKINGQILLNIVNNILEMSRLEAGNTELSIEQVDLVDIFGMVERTVNPLAEKKGIDINYSVESSVPVFKADWEKLRRIVENLVTNSVKYTHRCGIVSIRAYFIERDSKTAVINIIKQHSLIIGKPLVGGKDYVAIEVCDDGMGIVQENLGQIFEKFKQDSQSAYRRYKGTGLGLAVVKELVELHGGTIGVQSVSKQGSTFTVLLPIEKQKGSLQ